MEIQKQTRWLYETTVLDERTGVLERLEALSA